MLVQRLREAREKNAETTLNASREATSETTPWERDEHEDLESDIFGRYTMAMVRSDLAQRASRISTIMKFGAVADKDSSVNVNCLITILINMLQRRLDLFQNTKCLLIEEDHASSSKR